MSKAKNTKSKAKKTASTKISTTTKKVAPTKAVSTTKTAVTRKTTISTKPVKPATAKPSRIITTEIIAARAYILWEQAGRPNGRDVEYWLQAESQLKQEQSFAA